MLGALRPAYLSQIHPALLPGAICLAIGLPANLVARASSYSASPGNTSICQKRNGTQNFRTMGKAYYACGQRFFRRRAVPGLCGGRGGWGGVIKKNAKRTLIFGVLILANFQKRKMQIKTWIFGFQFWPILKVGNSI
jgi:hypothetical protein